MQLILNTICSTVSLHPHRTLQKILSRDLKSSAPPTTLVKLVKETRNYCQADPVPKHNRATNEKGNFGITLKHNLVST